jgi:hypothetical protein
MGARSDVVTIEERIDEAHISSRLREAYAPNEPTCAPPFSREAPAAHPRLAAFPVQRAGSADVCGTHHAKMILTPEWNEAGLLWMHPLEEPPWRAHGQAVPVVWDPPHGISRGG